MSETPPTTGGEAAEMLVREVMTTGVVTVPETASIKAAIRTLVEHDITAAPVVDPAGRMTGIVSEMDLLRGEFSADPRTFLRPHSHPDPELPRRVTQVMTREVRTATETTDVAELSELMITTGLKSIPVLRGEHIVGMVSRRDLMAALARPDAALRDEVLETIAECYPHSAGWRASVHDGVVELRGHADHKTADLIETLARTVPGVSRVVLVDDASAGPPG